MVDQMVWLVYADQRPADFVLEHVASTEEAARLWIENRKPYPGMPPEQDLWTVPRFVDDPAPIAYPS